MVNNPPENNSNESQNLNPFSVMLVNYSAEKFVGRRLEARKILSGISSKEPTSFSVSGIRTIGKTTLLEYLSDTDGALKEFSNDLEGFGPSGLEFKRIDAYRLNFSELLIQIWHALTSLDYNVPEDLHSELSSKFKSLIGTGTRTILCIDNFDWTYEKMTLEDEFKLRRYASYAAFIFITERQLMGIKPQGYTSPIAGITEAVTVGLLSLEQAYELFAEKFDEEELKFLIQVAGLQPYLLTVAAEFLYDLKYQQREDAYDETTHKVLNNKESSTRKQLLLRMNALPSTQLTFDLFWRGLKLSERRLLRQITLPTSPGTDVLDPEIGLVLVLLSLSLIQEETPGYKVFSELFSKYVERQIITDIKDEVIDFTLVLDRLGRKDRTVLEYLIKHQYRTCSTTELAEALWEGSTTARTEVAASISRVRSAFATRFGKDKEYIQTVRGQGYKLT